MSAIRDAALDLADRAHSVATQAIGTAHKRASSAVDTAEHQAGEAKQRLEAMQKRATTLPTASPRPGPACASRRRRWSTS